MNNYRYSNYKSILVLIVFRACWVGYRCSRSIREVLRKCAILDLSPSSTVVYNIQYSVLGDDVRLGAPLYLIRNDMLDQSIST